MILWCNCNFYLIYTIVIYKSGDFVYYHNNGQKLGRLRAILKGDNDDDGDDQCQLSIQKVLNYDDLPGIFKGRLRQSRSLIGEVWLQDEPFQTITKSQIIGKATVMIKFQHQHIPEGISQITEIIYKHNIR